MGTVWASRLGSTLDPGLGKHVGPLSKNEVWAEKSLAILATSLIHSLLLQSGAAWESPHSHRLPHIFQWGHHPAFSSLNLSIQTGISNQSPQRRQDNSKSHQVKHGKLKLEKMESFSIIFDFLHKPGHNQCLGSACEGEITSVIPPSCYCIQALIDFQLSLLI